MNYIDRFSLYYDTNETQIKIYEKSLNNERFNHLAKYVLKKKNILFAMKRLSTNPGRNTPGPDGLTYKDIRNYDDDTIVKLVKKRLMGDIRPQGRTVKIPKKNGSTRTLGIANILDRLAQYAIYNVLEPLTEPVYSSLSFGYRRGMSTKDCITRICSILRMTKYGGDIIDVDLTNYFDNVKLKYVFEKLENNFNVKDHKIFKMIRNTMEIPLDGIEYAKGLPQGTILGPVLANILLDDLDRKIWKLSGFNDGVHKEGRWLFHKGGLKLRKDGIEAYKEYRGEHRAVKIIRYADDFLLFSPNHVDIDDAFNIVKEWLEEHELEINERKTKKLSFEYGQPYNIDFLGYRLHNNGYNRITIGPKNASKAWKELKAKIRKIPYGDTNFDYKFLTIINGYFNYFDITTNLTWLIKRINYWLYRHREDYGLEKVEGKDEYIFRNTRINIWEIRKLTNASIKDYNKEFKIWDPRNVNNKDTIFEYIHELIEDSNPNLASYKVYLPGLIRKFRYEPLLEIPYESIDPRDLQVHHVRPKRIGGLNEFKNLVPLHRETHKMLTFKNYKPFGWSDEEIKEKINQNKLRFYQKKLLEY